MNRKGVTLVELIVVIVIIGICAALAVPNIAVGLRRYRLNSAIRDIASIFRVAQLGAVSRNITFRVECDQGTGTFTLQRNSGGMWIDEKSFLLPQGISIKEITLPGNTALFQSNATASSGGLTVRNSKGMERRVSLNATTGRVKIE